MNGNGRLVGAIGTSVSMGLWICLGIGVGMGATACTPESTAELVREANKLAERTGRRSELQAGDRALLESLFGDGLDADSIVLIYDSPAIQGASRTVENKIYFEKGLRLDDPAYRSSPEFVVLLSHEATHVWQYQNIGLRYIPDALFEQSIGMAVHGDRGEAYKYSAAAVSAFSDLNTEQQAKLVEEYVGLALFGRKPFRAQDYTPKTEADWLLQAQKVLGNGMRNGPPSLSAAQFGAFFDVRSPTADPSPEQSTE